MIRSSKRAGKTLRCLKDQRGMTLIEVMTAMVLLTVVFAGFTLLVESSSILNIRAAEARSAFQEKTQNIIMGEDLSEKNSTLQLTIDSQTSSVSDQVIPLSVTVKTTKKGGEPLAVIQ